MSLIVSADSGTEKFIQFAKHKLKQWKEAALRAGVATINKTIFGDEGTTIYVNSVKLGEGTYRDRVRITGGGATWHASDPIAPIWTLTGTDQGAQRAAVLPATRPGVGTFDQEPWAPTDQSVAIVSKKYLELPRTTTRTIGGVTYTVNINQEYTTEHTLVLRRYCKRVAEYSFTEVSTYDASYVPPVGQETVAFYTVTNGSFGYDITNVYLADVLADASEVNLRTVAHGLAAAALANPWGWCGENGVPPAPSISTVVDGPTTYAYLDAVKAILDTIPPLLDARISDVSEVIPAALVPYRTQRVVYLFPVKQTVQVQLTYADSGIYRAFALECDGRLRGMLFKTTSLTTGFPANELFYAQVKIPSTVPTPPYSSEAQRPIKYGFDPTTKTFSLASEIVVDGVPQPWFTYKKSYFSSGIDITRLQATPLGEISWGGLYKVTPSAAATTTFNAMLGKNDDATKPATYVNPAARMQAMCIGSPTFGDVTYAIYSSIFTTRGAAYRQTSHTYTSSGYTVTQAAIPNTDAP